MLLNCNTNYGKRIFNYRLLQNFRHTSCCMGSNGIILQTKSVACRRKFLLWLTSWNASPNIKHLPYKKELCGMLYVLCMWSCEPCNWPEINHRLRPLYHVLYFNMDQVSSTGRSLQARRQKKRKHSKHSEQLQSKSFCTFICFFYSTSLVSPC